MIDGDKKKKKGTGKNGEEAEISENIKLRSFVRYQEDPNAPLCLILCAPLTPPQNPFITQMET